MGLNIGNDVLVDFKDLTTSTAPDGEEISTLNHYRKINKREYIVRTTMRKKDGKTLESGSARVSQISDAEARKFLEEWNSKWKKRVITESEVETATEEAIKQAKKAKLEDSVLNKEE